MRRGGRLPAARWGPIRRKDSPSWWTVGCGATGADPAALAGFYSKVTGWDITSSDADTAYLSGADKIQLSFRRIAAATERGLLAFGAGKPEFQPSGDDWTVFVDPEGHLFCLVPQN